MLTAKTLSGINSDFVDLNLLRQYNFNIKYV
jgi:hypothetical protein